MKNSHRDLLLLPFLKTILLAVLMTSSIAWSATLPNANPVPGGIAIIPLEKVENSTQPDVYFNNSKVMVLEQDHEWYAVVGIPLEFSPGKHSLEWDKPSGKLTISFTVKTKEYETQHLTIKNKRKVNPNKKDLKRIKKETVKIRAALQHWTNQSTIQTRFILPVEGRLSSPFGLRRFFNGQPRKPHSGLDIAAPRGTPIKSPADGKVIATGNFFFNGNTVFLDHGQGLITMYCHMDHIDVKPGQMVKQGEPIGAIGMTGRVTGPHVHWSVSLNDARIDPSLFFSDRALAKLENPVEKK